MASKTRIKQPAEEIKIPQSRDETVEAIAEMGRRQRHRERIQADMNDELAQVRQRYEEQAAPHAKVIQDLSRGIRIWCEANRKELCRDGGKTSSLPSGQISWRLRPPSVSVRAVETVIATLKGLGLHRFIRTKEEINKEALLLEPGIIQSVNGLTLSRGEDFIIKPFETEMEEILK